MKRLTKILSAVLGIPESKITDDASPENVASWDSFNALLLVSELEKAFGISFTMDEVVKVNTVGKIKEALKKHGVQFEV